MPQEFGLMRQDKINPRLFNVEDSDSGKTVPETVFGSMSFASFAQSKAGRKTDGIQGRMVDALARDSDEGRGVAAICFGEVPSNL